MVTTTKTNRHKDNRMRRINFVSALLTAMLTGVLGCSKNGENMEVAYEDGMIKLSLTGELGEYAIDDAKGQLVNSVRVEWNNTDKVYVYDASQCLGVLDVTPKAEGKSATLSGNIQPPADGTTVLTFVNGSGFSATVGETLTDGRIKYDLSEQVGEKAPYMVYGTLPYSSSTVSDLSVQFSFATSVIRVNCTGLWTDGKASIRESFVTGLNNVCVITVNCAGEPAVSGETKLNDGMVNNTIVRRGLTSSAKIKKAGDDTDSGTGSFSIAVVPTAERSSTDRRLVMTIKTENSDEEHYRGLVFTNAELKKNTSYNTVLHLGEAFKVTARSSNAAWGTVGFKDGISGESACRYMFPDDEAMLVAESIEPYFFNAWRNDDEFQKVLSPTTEWLLKDVASDMAVVARFTEAYEPVGMLPGLFSVAPNHQIHFAKGNVQYRSPDKGATIEWRLAEHQYDYVGNAAGGTASTIEATGGNVYKSSNKNIFMIENTTTPYVGWVDIMPWGTTGKQCRDFSAVNPQSRVNKQWLPWSVSSNHDLFCPPSSESLHGDSEWGTLIGAGYRTLKGEEWTCLINRTDTEGNPKYGYAVVNGVNGLILLPDEFVDPVQNIRTGTAAAFVPGNSAYSDTFWKNSYSAEGWDKMEKAGAVFLPTCGSLSTNYHQASDVKNATTNGAYWAADEGSSNQRANAMSFTNNKVPSVSNAEFKSHFVAVRLVYDPSAGE